MMSDIPLKGILKTIEGDLQDTLYFNSQAIFSTNTADTYFHLRKIVSRLQDVIKKIENLGPTYSNPDPL